jgi:hypothetical protein
MAEVYPAHPVPMMMTFSMRCWFREPEYSNGPGRESIPATAISSHRQKLATGSSDG